MTVRKLGLALMAALLGATILSGVLAGCGSQNDSSKNGESPKGAEKKTAEAKQPASAKL